ncbi:hypothetical protein [Amycolatopsis sp. H20-H5]|uniref:hypothetical protein n=1 Tax=Amycolatopsis sp. H20-H5 TaxID=3046309 RepID=UPI002DBF5B11|nr:hypothetical protein [Amycolatopsis sp. H20-H5]MEC3977976.1 hypothetical protein [Amycolatopsis sp. H20-H5]
MSPVSRARKKNPQPATHSVTGLFKDILRDFSALGAEPDVFEVELLASEVLGEWWDLAADEEDGPLGLELIAFTARKITPAAAGLLAALRVLAETPEEREAAGIALETVLSRGIPAPEWKHGLAEVTIEECWRSGDVYGDQSSMLCVFSRGERSHGLLALVDFTEGGRIRDVVVVDEPLEVLAEMRQQAQADAELVTLEQVLPARAHQLLADGMAATDTLEEPDVSADYARFHALALAWSRALPAAEPSPETTEWPEAVRNEVVADFLGSGAVEDTEVNRACARLIVDFGCRTEPVAPLRVGPEKLARFLEDLLEGEHTDGEFTEEHEAALEPVLLGWTTWAASRAGLPAPALAPLLESVAEFLEEFTQEDDSALDAYLDGSEELDDPAELAEALDRRMFAVPTVYTEIGDEELDLEPTDPEQRRLLVIGEHPEYHEALAEDTFDGQPRMRLALKTALVDQLWDNEPPEAWQAARRLREGGLEREEILDRLGDVLAGQLQEAGEDEMNFDLDDYREALDLVN